MKKKLFGKITISFSIDLDANDDAEEMKDLAKKSLFFNGYLDDLEYEVEDIFGRAATKEAWDKEISITIEEE